MKNIYEQKYLKYKAKYLSLKAKLGGNNKILPLEERTKYTSIYYLNNGEINKLKEFF